MSVALGYSYRSKEQTQLAEALAVTSVCLSVCLSVGLSLCMLATIEGNAAGPHQRVNLAPTSENDRGSAYQSWVTWSIDLHYMLCVV